MLTQVKKEEANLPSVPVKNASFPSPFGAALEYGAPARGTWNIVHTGMLVPEAHEIFVCAAGCLRGVVLTAAEMGAQERFSTVEIREHNVTDGDMEELIIDGVSDILGKLPYTPRAVLVYTSCIHHFMGSDLARVYKILRERFPAIDFTDCYMDPIMRKSGLTPDQKMRRQLYSLLKPREKDGGVNIIGNDLATDQTSELVRLIASSGRPLREITGCTSYDEYQLMAASEINISYIPPAAAAGEALERRLGQRHLCLPASFGYARIEENLSALAGVLGVPLPDFASLRGRAEEALGKALAAVGAAPVAIDYTVSYSPAGLARLLCEHGFNVTELYADGFAAEEKEDFCWLQDNRPEIKLFPTVAPEMRVAPRRRAGKTLAIGQKAAYFTGSDNFVNIVEGGGMYGYDGICRLCGLIIDAWAHEKKAKELIQIKGWGCSCCL